MFDILKAKLFLMIVPALALTACGSAKDTPEAILAKAEAAATRAEAAQKAAEEAAEIARGKYRQIAQAESNTGSDEPEVPPPSQEVTSHEENPEPPRPENSEVVRD